MALDWAELQARYARGATLPSLAGGSTVRITSVDAEAISLSARLWRDSLARADLETAVRLLQEGAAPRDPLGFAEALRRYYSESVEARPGCSRIPNMAAVVLSDLGYLGDS